MNAIFDRIAFTTHYFNTPVCCHHRGNLYQYHRIPDKDTGPKVSKRWAVNSTPSSFDFI